MVLSRFVLGSVFAFTVMGVAPMAFAQSSDAVAADRTPLAASAQTAVPALVPFSGLVPAHDGNSPPRTVSITFLVFKQEQGGEPLWAESQTVATDTGGHYRVQLGATLAKGLPEDLFADGDARWLEVDVAGEAPQKRVLLLSVPYALKAADASTLGGLPASAFALASSVSSTGSLIVAQPQASANSVTTPGGSAGYLPVFTGPTTVGDSAIFQSGSDIGINTKTPATTLDINGPTLARGIFALNSTSTATAATGQNSQPLDFIGSTYNSGTKSAVNQIFSLLVEPLNNNTSSPDATLNFLFGSGAAVSETGLSINSKGILQFAPGQTFPGIGTGSSSITGVTAGSGLLGGGTSGNVKLSVDKSTIPTLTGSPTFNSQTNGLTGETSGYFYPSAGLLGVAGQRSTFSGIAGVWGDANAHVGVLGTSTMYAGVQGLSSTGPGMQGSSSTSDGIQGNTTGTTVNTAGVHGIAQSGTGYGGLRAGVWGESNSYVGVFGSSSAAPGVQGRSASGSGIQGYSATGSGGVGITQGNTLNTAGFLGTAGTSTGYGGIAGVWGDAAYHVGLFGSSIQYSGVYGVSTSSNGVLGQSNDTNAGDDVAGVYGQSSSGPPAVKGVASGPGAGGLFINASASNAAVTGINNLDRPGATANFPVGVKGTSAGYDGIGVAGIGSTGIGVYGQGGPGGGSYYFQTLVEGEYIGVWGDTTTTGSPRNSLAVFGTAGDSISGEFSNDSEDLPTIDSYNYYQDVYQGAAKAPGKVFQASNQHGNCAIGGQGDLTCTGQVKTVSATGGGSRLVETYAMQSPENWMEDFGSATMEHGIAHVVIDPAFAETVSRSAEYHVFLTANGDSKGLYVTAKSASGFEVHESGGGTSSLSFDYRIVAKRRGLEAQRMVDVTEGFKKDQERMAARIRRHDLISSQKPKP